MRCTCPPSHDLISFITVLDIKLGRSLLYCLVRYAPIPSLGWVLVSALQTPPEVKEVSIGGPQHLSPQKQKHMCRTSRSKLAALVVESIIAKTSHYVIKDLSLKQYSSSS